MKVFLTGRLQDFAMESLRKRHELVVHAGKMPIPRKKLLSGIRDADGLVCFPFDVIDQSIIDAAPHLKTISTYSVGYDHIDVEHAKSRKISIGYTPDVLTEATADLAFVLILDVARRVTEGDRIIRSGRWKSVYTADDYLGSDIQSKTLGILGMGRIGQAVAKRAGVFGMGVMYHSRRRIPRDMERMLGARYTGMAGLISRSDIISVHVPYTKETHELINSHTFQKMKDTAILVNTSRGRVVCQNDLVHALKHRLIGGAGLDVFETEPLPASDPLTKLDNVVLAPHIGSSTANTRKVMAVLTIKNLNLGLAGRPPIHSV